MKNSFDILNLGLWQSFKSEMKNAVWVFTFCFFLPLFMITIYVALLTFAYLVFQTQLSIVLLINLYAEHATLTPSVVLTFLNGPALVFVSVFSIAFQAVSYRYLR